MKLLRYLFFILTVITVESCNWPEQEIQPSYVKETAIFKFYNNGDSTLERMTLKALIHDPAEYPYATLDMLIPGRPAFCKEKTLSDHFTPDMLYYACEELHPCDSIVYNPTAYIGCGRYAQFAIYYKDETSPDGYRLRGEYVVKDTIKQKYEIGAYKYPDQTLIVNWPEDSLLFK
jgi:hypothetical protein